jgi:large subunit ribosomal protein L6
MRRPIYKEMEIPEGIEILADGNLITVKGPEGENKRELNLGKLKFEIKDRKIKLGHDKSSKNQKKQIHTIFAHIRNLIEGVQKKFEYTLKICFSHFPFTVKSEGNKVIIKNFLGEKVDRKTKIPENVEMDIQKDIITVKSINKEKAGQAAANLETATKVKGRDRRIFQDGIYIINKCGKEI